MKKSSLIIIAIMFILGISILGSVLAHADSGWDTSYDTGSSWDSDWDSDWGSDSWDSDWGSSGSYSSGGTFSGSLFLFQIIIIFIIIIMISSVINKDKNALVPFYYDEKKYDDKHIIAMLDIEKELKNFNEEEFNKMIYEKFIKVQEAWSNFNLDELKKHLTDELFNTYNSQLKILKAKKEKNVMCDFENIKVSIVDFKTSADEYTIKVLLRSKFYDFISNQNDVVLRGKNNKKVEMTYILTLVRKKVIKNNKCPNCNAVLENQHSNTCPYCNSKIVSNNYDWTISKKEAIYQRWGD